MKKLLMISFLWIGFSAVCQEEDLTVEEIQYRDSIANLNETNAAIQKSQEAFNAGISLIKSKKYSGAISKFAESITSDPNFTPAYYNKAIAENKAENYKAAIKTLDILTEKKT